MNQAKKSQLNKKDHPKDLFSQYINERAHSDLRRRLLLGGAAFAATALAGLNPLRRTWADSLLKSTADRPIVLTNLKLFVGIASAPQKAHKFRIVGIKYKDIF